jgi:hypothetical protein
LVWQIFSLYDGLTLPSPLVGEGTFHDATQDVLSQRYFKSQLHAELLRFCHLISRTQRL